MSQQILLLAPSRGLGGGIERYADTLQWAFAAQGIECLRLNLRQSEGDSSRLSHARMLARSREHLASASAPTRLVVMHRALLPVASLATIARSSCCISVVCHGNDVWGTRRRVRRRIENHLMGRTSVRVVAVSSFTAGALSSRCRAVVLPPGLSREWFQLLAQEAVRDKPAQQGISLVSAFRLASWEDKGLPQLLEAVAALDRPDIRLTVCGSGEPPTTLRELVDRYQFCVLRPGLTDSELARQLGAADLFVLATRTRPGLHPSGEGFGLVLLEAQVAGTPVIGPAYGGSRDAYIERVTGATPPDESAESLAAVLEEMLSDRQRLAEMGRHAAVWACETFAPERYASYVTSRLL